MPLQTVHRDGALALGCVFAGLVAKSLVVATFGDGRKPYRLLDTTRAYALEKLDESNERTPARRRHAAYYRAFFEQVRIALDARPAADWVAEYGRAIDNLRAALDWAFSVEGDASIGAELTAAAIPVWLRLSLIEECRARIKQAFATIANMEATTEMKLQAGLGVTLMYGRAVIDPEVGNVWTRALELAEGLGDTDYQLRALMGVWSFHIRDGQHSVALDLAQRFCRLATECCDPMGQLMGERLLADTEYLAGNLASARRRIEHVLSESGGFDRWRLITRFQIDHWSGSRALLARILWLQGFPEQAMQAAQVGIDDARNANHGVSTSYVLALAGCPVALLIGDLSTAEHYVAALIERSKNCGLTLWEGWGHYYQGVLLIRRGDLGEGLRLLRASMNVLGEARFAAWFVTFLSEAATALGRAGEVAAGLAEIEEGLVRFKHGEDEWLVADLLRSKGELLLLQGAARAATSAEACYRQALECARRKHVLGYELRAATSLARLLQGSDRSAEAFELLWPVYNRFTEGFDTADLKAAEVILDTLREPNSHFN